MERRKRSDEGGKERESERARERDETQRRCT
jgi:hypothetical protein